ncbi:MAG: SlyX family protein [Desulfobulbaceae bacterium]|nr:SlyX family protein [Desulfobulbaceae bacterium]
MEKLAARLTELETHLAFQDQTIEELHEVIYRQQGQLDELTRELAKLKNRWGQFAPDAPGQGANHG